MTPTIILTGFLGAGKTTLLNRLIEHYGSINTVLLINEFGTIGIDGQLLKEGNYHKIELNRGSLFCICIRTDFISEVKRITDEIKPDLLIIEATGLADTSDMEKMLALQELRKRINLKACVCMVDSQNFKKVRKYAKAPDTQVKCSDIILINKIDLVSKAEVENIVDEVKKLAPEKPVFLTEYTNFPLEELDKINRIQIPVNSEPGSGMPDPFTSISLESDGSFTENNFNRFITDINKNLFRIKGFVKIDNATYHVEANTESVNKYKVKSKLKLEKNNMLVLIGKDLNKEAIKEKFIRCLALN
ncbi:MAG TPA: GTP-binding protein [Victivallales bacterium]|nr:GTP-binding protein [Victivallales bacterium]